MLDMLVTEFLNFCDLFLSGVVNLLPNGVMPADISSSFTFLVGVVNTYNYVVPLKTLLAAAGVVLIFDSAMLLWHLLNWVIRKIPGMQ